MYQGLQVLEAAPVFTSRQEEIERNSLSLFEKEIIQSDVYGPSSTTNVKQGNDNNDHFSSLQSSSPVTIDSNNIVNEEIIDDRIDDLEIEILKIPLEKKISYLRALEFCPDLVVTESDPLLFLKSCDDNIQKTALKLVEYWRVRVEVFGEDRAYLPMTLNEALADDLNELLEMPNLIRILPTDRYGRTVMCGNLKGVDLNEYDDNFIAVRYLWYISNIATQLESTSNGIVLINVNKELRQFYRKRNKMVVKSLLCFPFKIKALHLIMNSFMEKYVMPVSKFFMNKEIRQRIQIHKHENRFDDGFNSLDNDVLLGTLESYGIFLNRDVTFLDGSQRLSWIEERILIEASSD